MKGCRYRGDAKIDLSEILLAGEGVGAAKPVRLFFADSVSKCLLFLGKRVECVLSAVTSAVTHEGSGVKGRQSSNADPIFSSAGGGHGY